MEYPEGLNELQQKWWELERLDNSEVWKPVKDYEKSHIVSKLGQVYSLIGKKLLLSRRLRGGKLYVTLNYKGARSTLQNDLVRDAVWTPTSPKVKLLSGKRVGSIISSEPTITEPYSTAKVIGKGLVSLTIKRK